MLLQKYQKGPQSLCNHYEVYEDLEPRIENLLFNNNST